MKKIIFLFAFLITSSVIVAQVNLKKLSSPCDCVKEAIKVSEDLVKNVENADSAFVKQNYLDHFIIDKELIIDYCDKQYDMKSGLSDCKYFNEFVSLNKQINEIIEKVEVQLRDSPYLKSREVEKRTQEEK